MESIFDSIVDAMELLLKGALYIIFGIIVFIFKIIESREKYKKREAKKRAENMFTEPELTQTKVYVSKNKYVKLAFFLGWIGAHKFYEKKIFVGLLYLVFFSTGIPFIISLFEGFSVLKRKADIYGNIQL